MKRKRYIKGFILAILAAGYFCASLLAGNPASMVISVTVDPYAPGAISSLSANSGAELGEISLEWFAPSDDGAVYTKQLPQGAYVIKYNTRPVNSFSNKDEWWDKSTVYYDLSWYPWYPQEPGCVENRMIKNLLVNATYYFGIQSVDAAGNLSEVSNVASIKAKWDICPPLSVTDLVAHLSENKTGIVLEWAAPLDYEPYEPYINVNTKGKVYRYQIKRSTVSLGEFSGDETAWWNTASEISPIEPAEPGVRQSIELKDLTGGVTYYFAIKSFDEQGNISGISNFADGIIIESAATPNQVSGIYAQISGNKFTIHWSSVTFNKDGTVCEDLAGYYIRCSLNPFDVGKITAAVSVIATSYETYYSTNNPVYYYSITAFDGASPRVNESQTSMRVDSSKEMSLWLCSQKAAIRIPKTIQKIMSRESNSYGDNLNIEIERVAGEEKSRILCSYLFDAVENVSKQSAGKFVFRRPYAEIRLYYSAAPGQTALLQSGDSYSIMWYNGKEWLKLGGDVNKEEGFVSVKTERIGKYQLRRSIRATKFTLVNGPIPKIITPNGDGLNDFCEFFYDNPQNFAPSGKLFDITGAFVANMANGPSRSDSSGSLRWDGKDNSGRTVASGIYIYQLEAGGQVYNGTVIVAR